MTIAVAIVSFAKINMKLNITLMNERSMLQAVKQVKQAYPFPVEVESVFPHYGCCKQYSTFFKSLPAPPQQFMSSVSQVIKEISASPWHYEGMTGYSRLH